MDNAAFDQDPHYELARILRNLAAKIDAGGGTCPLLDVNGNTVGEFLIIGKRRRE